MEDSGNVYFYAALVLIAFISWVVGRVREAIESFRERQRLESRRRSGGSPSPPSAPAPAHRPESAAPTREQLAAQALRETYRALGVPFPDEPKTEPPPALSKPKPSPSPSAKSASAQAVAKLTYNERAALASVARRTASTAISDSRGGDAAALRRLLGDRSSVRQAIVLNEVLSPPKALRSEDR